MINFGEFFKFLCEWILSKIFKSLCWVNFAECHRPEPKFWWPYLKFCLMLPPPWTKILATPLTSSCISISICTDEPKIVLSTIILFLNTYTCSYSYFINCVNVDFELRGYVNYCFVNLFWNLEDREVAMANIEFNVIIISITFSCSDFEWRS